ncbi:hypothetical protein NVV95_01045 [Herbiconiux sp. CPCC 205716]|uniref:Immunity MXAN-0049 protein domain-containing protein n=2 Tax=Herbiconiux gentiana TaxID=2970912 RepID=A0ABT2GCU9_9MICO|nr:DUF1629 domain-containing protein [Herbiconiux gentiana]MCS5713130.1 hypothetical protein [Herbiconiux gentiana]
MDPRYPHRRRLADYCYSVNQFVVISGRLRNFLDAHAVQAEYLPARIYDGRGRLASYDYMVANVQTVLDVIDQEKSIIEFNPHAPRIQRADRLVIDSDAIAVDIMAFRPRYLPEVLIVRESFANKLESARFTGLDLDTLTQFVE